MKQKLIIKTQSDLSQAVASLFELPKLLAEGKRFDFEVKPHRPKRSLDSNAYFHLLVGEIAKVLGIGMEECKRQLNLDYGTIMKDENGGKVGIKLPTTVNVNEIYGYAKWFDKRWENGKEFNCYLIYKPTHTLDSKEMARLIEGVVYEAKELGIETRTPDEIAQMNSLWAEKEKELI